MESLWTLVVALALGGWFVASVLHQLRRRWWEPVARFDVLNLLPRWTFFAPNPGRHDIHVVYRDWFEFEPQPWRELTAPCSHRRWRWIWNPARYPKKAANDLANGLLPMIGADEETTRAHMLSLPYIGLLSWVMSQPTLDASTSHRQFALVRTQGFGQDRRIEVRYVSETHRLSP